MIDQRITLSRAGDDLLGVCMTIEGIGGALLALASDIDGQRTVTDVQIVRVIELLAGCCDGAVHRLGIVHDMIEAAAEGEEGKNETP